MYSNTAWTVLSNRMSSAVVPASLSVTLHCNGVYYKYCKICY